MDAMEKAELITEKEELEQRLEKIRKDLATGLSADFDRIQELANQHQTLRLMLGHGLFTADKNYRLQTLKDNLALFTPDIMARINVEVIRAGHQLLDIDIELCPNLVYE